MAVFTQLTKKDIENFLNDYSIGSLLSYEGIIKGTENTNYKIITSKNKYILTIFEKRVRSDDLPFFMNLQKELAAHGFDCPIPINNNENSIINKLKEKKAVIISFLQGENLTYVMPEHCHELGLKIADFTNITKNSKLSRQNSLGYENWVSIYENFKNINDNSYEEYLAVLKKELFFLKKNWPTNLPTAIIHADLFIDNVLFIKNKISGIIDYYFSCRDFIAYELALTINAWCFNKDASFNDENFKSLITGFNSSSSLNKEEKTSMNVLLRGAAVRILVTRLYDKIFHPNDALVELKNPKEYLNILKWHQNNKDINL
ncbi:MAG: homoserine kinase [Pelagibacteraceae bacterium]|nr:homoserine kinase [Pelagibacteraceae bacterium]|tara:strand:- start:29682 stop:30632 length:951 start_codon:yes stop_codon:yes gene_type:complete